MNNPHLALIFIRQFPDFFRKQLDQLSIFFRGNAASSDSGRAACASRFMTGWRKPALTPPGHLSPLAGRFDQDHVALHAPHGRHRA